MSTIPFGEPPSAGKTAPRHHADKVARYARLLVIRFSSFGDIIQASSVPASFRKIFPEAEVDWLIRSDFKDLLQQHPIISQVIPFDRKAGLTGLFKLARELAATGQYTHIYDAHNNLRSRLFTLTYFLTAMMGRQRRFHFARRPKDRLRRWLFFQFRLPVLPRPFRGAESFHRPLAKWGIEPEVPQGPQYWGQSSLPPSVLRDLRLLPRPLIIAAPSAAWAMKRWPVEHWKKLLSLMPHAGFVFLGGPEDLFISEITALAPERTMNLAGRLNLAQSVSALPFADLVIANDTGLLHAADQMERPTLALIGPTAFGYPSHRTSEVLEIELNCKPCSKDGRGKCVNTLYQRCLVELTPEHVAEQAQKLLARQAESKASKS